MQLGPSDGDKNPGDDKQTEKMTIETTGVVVKQVITENLLDEKNSKTKADYEEVFLKLSGAGEGSSIAYKLVDVRGRKLRRLQQYLGSDGGASRRS